MNQEKDYTRDLAEIRAMMERSSKFLSLAGWAGIMAGLYALAGAYIAYTYFDFHPDSMAAGTDSPGGLSASSLSVLVVAVLVLVLAVGTAVLLSYRKANGRGEKVWNATSRRLLASMAVPLVAGGILVLILFLKGFLGLMAPLTLLFYGIALHNASTFTFPEIRSLGIIQIVLGLVSAYFVEYGVLLWAIGFGAAHIAYGIHMHLKYER